jgi:hypothetical protein
MSIHPEIPRKSRDPVGRDEETRQGLGDERLEAREFRSARPFVRPGEHGKQLKCLRRSVTLQHTHPKPMRVGSSGALVRHVARHDPVAADEGVNQRSGCAWRLMPVHVLKSPERCHRLAPAVPVALHDDQQFRPLCSDDARRGSYWRCRTSGRSGSDGRHGSITLPPHPEIHRVDTGDSDHPRPDRAHGPRTALRQRCDPAIRATDVAVQQVESRRSGPDKTRSSCLDGSPDGCYFTPAFLPVPAPAFPFLFAMASFSVTVTLPLPVTEGDRPCLVPRYADCRMSSD